MTPQQREAFIEAYETEAWRLVVDDIEYAEEIWDAACEWQAAQAQQCGHSSRWTRRVSGWLSLICDMQAAGFPKHLQRRATQVQKEIARYLEHGGRQPAQQVTEEDK